MRRYRPFLIYNPRKGWAFYPNHQTSPLTHKNIGQHRKSMRRAIGWFLDPKVAVMMERRERSL